MKEKHSAVAEAAGMTKKSHSHNLRSEALGRPKIRDPSDNGVGITQVEKIKKESNDGKIPERRFDEPPFDPVTRDKSIRMLDASMITNILKLSTYLGNYSYGTGPSSF